nr:phosphatase PAP2 family protein [Streptomyces natalensis]
MRETPRSQGTAGDARSALPRLRSGRALAHTTGTPGTGAGGSGNPHRSDARPSHTPRGARDTGRPGRLGTTPPVPRRPSPFCTPFLVGTLCALAFAVISGQVAGAGPLRAADERVGSALAGSAIPRGLAEFFADLGNTAVALPVVLVVAGWAAWRVGRGRRRPSRDAEAGGPVRWWLPPLAAALTLAALPALVVPLKLWFARPGPPQMGADAHEGFYPSGHGATAAVAYGLAALLVIRAGAGRRRGRGLLVAAAVLLNAGVGLGLVRRGYHWPLDVLGSWCLAGVLLAVWWAVCARWAGDDAPSGGDAPRTP